MTTDLTVHTEHTTLRIRLRDGEIAVDVNLPSPASGLIIMAGSPGNGRNSAVSMRVAEILNEAGFATALADLISVEERDLNRHTGELCCGIDLLERRVLAITDWVRMQRNLRDLPVGYFGDGLGAESALIAATKRPEVIKAAVLCGARLGHMAQTMRGMFTPSLFVAGGEDSELLNNEFSNLSNLPRSTVRRWQVVGRSPDPLDDPGQVDRIAAAARGWFERYLPASTR